MWPGKASHLPAVALDTATLLVVDVRCLEKPTAPSSLKPQGWTVLPIFADGGKRRDAVVDSGLHQLPLFEGVPSAEVLTALSKVASKPILEWQRALGQLSHEKKLKAVDGASVTLSLLDAQRYGEFDWPEQRQQLQLSKVRLPLGYEARYAAGATKMSKPLGSLVGKVKGAVPTGAPKGTKPKVLSELELLDVANAAFRVAMGLPAAIKQVSISPPKERPKTGAAAAAAAAGAGTPASDGITDGGAGALPPATAPPVPPIAAGDAAASAQRLDVGAAAPGVAEPTPRPTSGVTPPAPPPPA